ncbi:META domain-containing protein [Hyphomicrobium sp.]|uniref:META domain-containing protein n=1 Tax=Hyphomicrobium sp. TaxID=82 RepID=UPI001DF8B878|nr:META domain-containing protein [Hyphomicrobium sp.]MBY0559573.1 META domain-containing protein [Hyphomicrobium sp.]
MRFIKVIVIGALALAMSGPVLAEDDEDGPLAASWVAIELNGQRVEGLTFDYTTEKVSGTGGCNRFSGPISIEDDAIQIGPLAATKMACGGKSKIEMQYFLALEAARSFVVEGDVLTLKGDDGHVLAKFKK